MQRVIRMNKKAAEAELSPKKEQVVKALGRLGADKEPVDFTQLKKACRSVAPKVLRARVRELVEEKLISVKRVA